MRLHPEMAATTPLSSKLAAFLTDAPTRAQTCAFVTLCRRIAMAYLGKKQRRHRLAPALQHLALEDLAIDAIAALFERDERGVFIHIARYYTQIGWQEMDEDPLFEATRRLVFNTVNDYLFHYYGQADASLSNLLRSLKRAVSKTEGLVLERRAGILWLQATRTAESDISLLMPPEFLEAHLTAVIRHGVSTRDILQAAAAVLATQTRYAQGYPLTRLAQVIRSATVRVNEAVDDTPPMVDPLHAADITRCLEHSIAATQSAMRATYVDKGKVDEATYQCYFSAIRARMIAEYVHHDGHTMTNYEALCVYLPALSRKDYGRKHRPVFEYLARCTRERLVTSLHEDG